MGFCVSVVRCRPHLSWRSGWTETCLWAAMTSRWPSPSVTQGKGSRNERPHDKTNKMACQPSEDSDQPGHQSSLIRGFACAPWVTKDSCFHHVDIKDWSDWADAQNDLRLCWEHTPFCWFCHASAQIIYKSYSIITMLVYSWLCRAVNNISVMLSCGPRICGTSAWLLTNDKLVLWY